MSRVVINPTLQFTRLAHTDGSSVIVEATRIEYNDTHYSTVTQSRTVDEFLAESRTKIIRAFSDLTTDRTLGGSREWMPEYLPGEPTHDSTSP
jgi:hypothetical protein